MGKFIALLRGINVSGQKKIKMSELKILFEDISFTNVETHIQSGNVLFLSDLNDKKTIRERLEKKLNVFTKTRNYKTVKTLFEMTKSN